MVGGAGGSANLAGHGVTHRSDAVLQLHVGFYLVRLGHEPEPLQMPVRVFQVRGPVLHVMDHVLVVLLRRYPLPKLSRFALRNAVVPVAVQGVRVDDAVPQSALDDAGRTRAVLVHVPAPPYVERRTLALQRHAQRPLQMLVGDPRPGGSRGGSTFLLSLCMFSISRK